MGMFANSTEVGHWDTTTVCSYATLPYQCKQSKLPIYLHRWSIEFQQMDCTLRSYLQTNCDGTKCKSSLKMLSIVFLHFSQIFSQHCENFMHSILMIEPNLFRSRLTFSQQYEIALNCTAMFWLLIDRRRFAIWIFQSKTWRCHRKRYERSISIRIAPTAYYSKPEMPQQSQANKLSRQNSHTVSVDPMVNCIKWYFRTLNATRSVWSFAKSNSQKLKRMIQVARI